MSKRIVLVTDSLGMPRGEPDNIPLEETWPNMVYQKYKNNCEVFFFPQRAMTTKDVVQKSTDCISLMKPDIIVIQVGIVDSCRRIFPRRMTILLGVLHLYDFMYKYFFKRHYYQWTRFIKTQMVNRDSFRANVSRILAEAKKAKAKCIMIAIAPPGKYVKDMVYDIKNDIEEYNKILKEETENKNGILADPYYGRDLETFLLKDGQHLNSLGAKYVFDELDKILKKYIEK